MTFALQGEGLWPHCSLAWQILWTLQTKLPPLPIDAEKEELLDWLAKDARVKLRIDQTISRTIAHLLGRSQTARQNWELLSQYCSRNDTLATRTFVPHFERGRYRKGIANRRR